MATKPEVDAYVQEQWRKLRLAGDWRQTAEEFFRWGEKQFWRCHKTWQSICDGFIERARERTARRREQAAQAVHKDSSSLLVCTLCWKVHDAHDQDRPDDEKLPECMCAHMTGADPMLWQVLRASQDLVLLTFASRRPALMEVVERIGAARRRAMEGERGEAYERRSAPWFEAIGVQRGEVAE